MSRYDAHTREEQKAILSGLLGIIYDNYDTTRRMQVTVDGIHRIVITMLVILLLFVTAAVVSLCVIGCRRYQAETRQSLRPKSAPIEI
ncbi:unnamed protein product [Anisakis simplex]|uniref:Transmembrane protein n=1 Tax=Anisakis simplex TaxID=6269 RepID=A0A0M3JM68_ANISI|nr:unnamed protein product [Anisakis simplex]